MIVLTGGYVRPDFGSVHLGMSTRVSRGMLTTEALSRSAARWMSICTSPRGGVPRSFLAPPSSTFSSELRLSEPISRMFRGVCPDAFGAARLALESPLLRWPFSMLPFRCS